MAMSLVARWQTHYITLSIYYTAWIYYCLNIIIVHWKTNIMPFLDIIHVTSPVHYTYIKMLIWFIHNYQNYQKIDSGGLIFCMSCGGKWYILNHPFLLIFPISSSSYVRSYVLNGQSIFMKVTSVPARWMSLLGAHFCLLSRVVIILLNYLMFVFCSNCSFS